MFQELSLLHTHTNHYSCVINIASHANNSSHSCKCLITMSKLNHQTLVLELTVLSAEGLKMKPTTPLFSPPLRPFITLSTGQPTPYMHGNDNCPPRHLYKTIVDQIGGNNPTWGDKFSIPINFNTSIYIQIFSKAFLVGKKRLGWCQIPAIDIFEGCRPAGMVHHLSYRVRAADGSRGHGVVNIAVRLVGVEFGSGSVGSHKFSPGGFTNFPATSTQIVPGIPISMFPNLNIRHVISSAAGLTS